MKQPDLNRLQQALLSEVSEKRKKAIGEIRRLAPDIALPLLIRSLGERNQDVLADLSKAFLSFKDAALPYLVQAMSGDTWPVRKAASLMIGSLGDGSLKKFLELIPQNEEDVDFWMVQTLSIMGGEAIPYLIRAFRHPNEKICLAALRAAGNVADARVVPGLLNLLEDNNWPIRKAAYDSLEKVHHLAPNAVLEALKSAPNEAKYWVIKLVASRGNRELLPVFIDIIGRDPVESKLEAIRAIARIETKDAHRVLIDLLADKTWIIRKTAADAIWEQGLGVSDELLSAVAATNEDTRYWSVKLLGQSNEPKVIPSLLECLHDPAPAVRVAACQALGTLGDKRALAPLMALLADANEDVRTQAVLAISQIGDKDDKTLQQPSIPRHLLAENMTDCPACGKLVGKTFTFCPFCLGHLALTCRKCGRNLEIGWKGCPNCGEPVAAPR